MCRPASADTQYTWDVICVLAVEPGRPKTNDFYWFGQLSTSAPDCRIKKMGIKTGVQGWSMAAWARQQQQNRWVQPWDTLQSDQHLLQGGQVGWGALSWSSQVELERDVELERWVETVGISKGQDLCWFSQEYRVGETAQGACMCGWVGVHVFLHLWGPKVHRMKNSERVARLYFWEQILVKFSKWQFRKVYWFKCVHVYVCLICVLGMLPTSL